MRMLTVQDLELFYTGAGGHPFLPLDEWYEIRKDTLTALDTSLTPVQQRFNVVYGAEAWVQLNAEANVFGVLPKLSWSKSGWRVITDWDTTYSNMAVGETDTLPTPTAVNIQIVKAVPKIAVNTFEVSDVLQALSEMSNDDVYGSIEDVRMFYAIEHRKLVNQMLIRRAIGDSGSNSESSSEKKFETLDRIVSSYSESQIGGTDAVGSAVDVYGLDRHSAESWADAYVNHNNGTLRSLTDELIRTSLQEIRENGGNTTVIITGYDTYAEIQGLYMNYLRYNPMGETQIQLGLNGIQTAKGIDAGLKVASLYGIPLITAVDTPTEPSSGSLSRIYMLDTSNPEGFSSPRLGISILRPTEYFEARDPLLLNKFVIKGAYRTVGEITCRFFKAQGKIRDLSA